MPYIETKLSVKLNEEQKDLLQKKLTNAVSVAFGKPTAYIMAGIEDDKSLYMGGKKAENGAYLSVSLLGTASKESCNRLTSEICSILKSDCGINPANVYVTYHPVDLWGWNNMMF